MSIPADWSVHVAPDSLGVRIMAVNNYGDVSGTLVVLTHAQARALSAALLSSFREARDAAPPKVLA
jgi:hypothetical protein